MSENETIRLNKALAAAGVASRRKADDLIKEGAVRINGEVVDTPGVSVNPAKDRIEVHGKRVSVRTDAADHVYLAMYKPIKTMTTLKDPKGRPTIVDLLPPEAIKARVFPVGRLDFMSEGLLLLTTDGDLAHKMAHPSHHLPKVYRVKVRGQVTEAHLEPMLSGMRLEGERDRPAEDVAPVQVRTANHKGNTTVLEMTLIQGVNRQIRRMCAAVGLPIIWLKRVSQGPVGLGGLKPGEVRPLTAKEIADLKRDVAAG